MSNSINQDLFSKVNDLIIWDKDDVGDNHNYKGRWLCGVILRMKDSSGNINNKTFLCLQDNFLKTEEEKLRIKKIVTNWVKNNQSYSHFELLEDEKSGDDFAKWDGESK